VEKKDNTRDKILRVAGELFLTKGYDDTRISDIIDGLDGLTKGAVYHYFDSKEDIFEAMIDQLNEKNVAMFDYILMDDSLNGHDKLVKMINNGKDNDTTVMVMDMTPKLLTNPKLLASFMRDIEEITLPRYILPVIKEGISDGSINTKYPSELAQLILVLLNVWLNPLMFDADENMMKHKMKMINEILKEFNIELFKLK